MDNYGFLYRYCENVVPLPTPNAANKALLTCVYVLGLFYNDRFQEAASYLMNVDYVKYESELRKVMTPSDYAYYLTICALATFSRTALKRLAESTSVKSVLESVPELAGILHDFLSSQYKEVFAKTGLIRTANKFNTLFSNKAETLLRMIVERGIVQYCLPYKSVDMRTMSKALDIHMLSLEEILVGMSASGLIKAKIDSHDKVLYLKKEDVKAKCFRTVLENGKKFIQQANEAMLKMKMTKAGLVLRPSDADMMAAQEGRLMGAMGEQAMPMDEEQQ